MDTSQHDMQGLFAQLGLPDSEASIENFIRNNHLPPDVPLENAAFWVPARPSLSARRLRWTPTGRRWLTTSTPNCVTDAVLRP